MHIRFTKSHRSLILLDKFGAEGLQNFENIMVTFLENGKFRLEMKMPTWKQIWITLRPTRF